MRRSIVQAGLAAAISLLAACGSDRARPAPGCLAAGAGCSSNADCCSYGCAPPLGGGAPVCQCNPLPGGLCATTADCCNSTYGPVTCRDNQCLDVCRNLGEDCTSGVTQCCSGYCNPARQCAPPCRAFGQSCTLSNDCCAGLGCPGVTCSFTCGTTNAPCTGDGQCCSGWFCGGTVCVQGTCSAQGLPCGSNDQCCQSPKHLKCDAGTGTCECGAIGTTCADDLDCCSGFTCRTGSAPGSLPQCHPAAPRVDGSACIDPSDCTSTTCVVPAGQTLGSCCTAKSGACSAGICCAPSVCLSGVQTCQDCLNAGTATGAATDCCQDPVPLDYLGGKCCYRPATACLADGECCPVNGRATFCATTAASGASTVCCSGYDTLCDASHPCCSGYACDGGLCKVAPAEACTPAVLDCRAADSCFNGTCCQHPSRPCTGPAECCTGLCPAGQCVASGPGGTCATGGDCATAGSTCNPATHECCAVVTQPCAVAADCCEVNSLCAVPTGGASLTCCRPLQASATSASQCCSNNVSAGKCCAPLKAACATSNDCCAATGVTCVVPTGGAALACCIGGGVAPPGGDATLCCSGNKLGNGLCSN